MDRSTESQRLVRTLRLDDERLTKLLDSLDGGAASPPEKRDAPRYRYRVKTLVVHMQQPGFATPVSYLVVGRNISAKGLAFLHGGYVHTGTRCIVQLITGYGTWNDVTGTVIRCRYLDSNVHEVVAGFDGEVNPALYCSEAVESRILLVEDNAALARLATFQLQQLNAQVEHVENGQLAVERAGQTTYDLILMDMDMPVMVGFQAATELRRRGYSGMIVAATGLTQPGDRERCLAAGCEKYLAKPYSRTDLSALLESLRLEPLFSSFHDDPAMKDLIQSFVAELSTNVKAIEEAVVQQDVKHIEQLCRNLKSEGTGYGFEVISETAGKIETALRQEAPLASLRTEINGLVKLCLQARAAIRTATPAEPPASNASAAVEPAAESPAAVKH